MIFRNILAAGSVALALFGVACGSSNRDLGLGDDGGGGTSSEGATSTCPSCSTDSDCNGDRCVQIAGGLYCAPACGSGNTCSTSGDSCVGVNSFDNQQVQVCVPPGDCAPSASSSGGTSSGGASSS